MLAKFIIGRYIECFILYLVVVSAFVVPISLVCLALGSAITVAGVSKLIVVSSAITAIIATYTSRNFE